MKTTIHSGSLRVIPALASALSISFLTTLCAQDPIGDYGDAPDDSASYYPEMFPTSSDNGRFPTKYQTGNSRVGQTGVRHITPGLEWFGKQASATSAENGASDSTDPDGWPNLVNSDRADDGLPEIPFFILLTSIPPAATLSFHVSVDASAPAVTRYVNILIDWDQDGVWEDKPAPALPEWVVQNMLVDVAPGTTKRFPSTPFFWGWNALLSPQIFWVRMTLTRQPIGVGGSYPYLDINGCWDGSGTFDFGETEDYLFHPNIPLKSDGPGNLPDDPDAGGGGGGGGGGGEWATLRIKPKEQTISHKSIAYVDIYKDPPFFVNPAGPPTIGHWRIGNRAERRPSDGAGWDNFTIPSSGTTIEISDPPIPGGPPGTVFTFKYKPLTHPMDPPSESLFIRVRVRWPDILSSIKKATVHIKHSSKGSFCVNNCISHVGTIITEAPLDEATKSMMSQFAEEAGTSFEFGDYATAIARLNDIDAEAANHEAELRSMGRQLTPPPDETFFDVFTDILASTDSLREWMNEIEATTGPLPAPIMTSPRDADWARGLIDLEARCIFPGVTDLRFQRWDPTAAAGTGDWVTIADELLIDGVASTILDTTTLDDGELQLRVYALGPGIPLFDPDNGYDMLDLHIVEVDNTPPAEYPVDLTPINPEFAEFGAFSVTGIDEDFIGSCSLQLSLDEINWFTMGQSYYFGDPDDEVPPEPVIVIADVSSLSEGDYHTRVLLSDEAGNELAFAPAPGTVHVHPCYGAWTMDLGIPDADDLEDIDGDQRGLLLEYYSNTDPNVFDSPAPNTLLLTRDPGSGNALLSTHHPVPRGGILGDFASSPDLTGSGWTPLNYHVDMQETDNVLEVPLTLDKEFFKLMLTEP